MTLGFRNRLALFLLATLLLVQGFTIYFVYTSTKQALIRQSEQDLVKAADVFQRHLDTLADRLTESARILSQDYQLRAALAGALGGDDTSTAMSALRNFGNRAGASRVLLVGLEGKVAVDTAPVAGAAAAGAFAFPALLDSDPDSPAKATLAVLDGTAYRLVVTQLQAPTLIGWLAMAVQIDDGLANELLTLSSVPKALGLLAQTAPGKWTIAGSSGPLAPPMAALPDTMRSGQIAEPVLMDVQGEQIVELVAALRSAPGSMPVSAVLQFSLDDALRAYAGLQTTLLVILAGGLGAALVGTYMISRTVTRPVAALAAVARKIESGDYASVRDAAPARDEFGQLSSAMGQMARAIGEREERIRFQAKHDALTGLPNRLSLEEDLDALLAECGAQGRPAALLLIDFTRMAEIKVTLGHELADRMVRDGALRLAAAVGEHPIARVSDSSFALVLDGVGAIAVRNMAEAVVGRFETPYMDNEMRIDADVALGVALFPDHGTTARVLLQRADVALFSARRLAGRVDIYDAERDPHRPERLSLMGDLREAIDGEGLVLHYQPKINIATGALIGAEALVRWHHPQRGFMPPDLFIPMAEETGTVHRLTRWVLRTAIAQAAGWSRAGLPIYVAVNLSARDLVERDLPDLIDGMLMEAGLPRDRLVLEVTESAVMSDPDEALAVMRRLQQMGLILSLDDFGVGQSSLTYLRRLPVQEIKIDKSFVLKLSGSPEDQTIVRSIIDLGRNLGYRVTAEGVEDAASLDLLRTMGCDTAQGYLVSRPLATAAFEGFVQSWHAKQAQVQATAPEAAK